MTAKRKYAAQRDRDVAALIATGLRNRLGPDDETPADAVVWSIDDVLYLLDHFVTHGTFDLDVNKRAMTRSRRAALIPPFYRMMRDDGDTYEVAVGRLAKEFHCSETAVRTLVPSGYVKKVAPVLK